MLIAEQQKEERPDDRQEEYQQTPGHRRRRVLLRHQDEADRQGAEYGTENSCSGGDELPVRLELLRPGHASFLAGELHISYTTGPQALPGSSCPRGFDS